MQSDIVASCVTVAARLSASVTHDTPSRFPLAGIVGTILTGGESSLPDFRDVISGAFKVSSPSSLSLRVPHYD